MNKINFTVLIVCTFIISIANAQFTDDFSDGVLSNEWTGDRDKFIIDSEVLRLNDNDVGSAYLARPSSVVSNTQWDFLVRIGFEPSDNNYPLIYLVADTDDLSGPVNGYYVRIGKTGTDNKKLFFYRQDGESHEEILSGSNNIAASSNNVINVKVIRDDAGNWEFYADPAGGDLFLPQGSIFDDTYTTTEYFGISCNYTVSNSDRFYFDDFRIGDIIPETEKPEVKYTVPVNSTTLDAHFTKVIDQASAENLTNYFVNSGIGAPVMAQRLEDKPYVVRLMFSEEFIPETPYQISISNVQDVFGNVMNDFTGTFHLYFPERFDVVFNELMPNPEPPIDLPPSKFVEFYNTTDYQISVEGWSFKSGTDAIKELPFGIIPPKGYIILVNDADLQHFNDYENVIGASLGVNFLTISGRTIILYDANGEIMHNVSYTDNWYHDSSKDDGGWSIEQIDPYNFCGGEYNWRASVSPRGGTPGELNSVDDENPNDTSPNLLRAGVDDPSNITLVFSEPMDENSLLSTDNYELDNGIGNPVDVSPVEADFQKVRLQLASPLQEGTIYNVTVATTLADCAGNTISKNTAKVAIPEKADSLDVVINELLSNAPADVPRYIELYNNSQKVIELLNYRISSKDTVENILTSIREITNESFLFFPGEYIVLTTNSTAVKEYYPYNNPYSFIDIETMPSMTNSSGIVAFSHKSMEIIDMVVYNEDWQYALLTNPKGVALERLNPSRPTQDSSNWHSAAEEYGFGTPGMKNSQYTDNIDTQEDVISVYPEIFSPDNDGVDDVLNIAYEFDEPGYTANITIYDDKGRLVRTLARSMLLATKGVITWDGTKDDNQKAYIGIYIVHVEVFDTKGNVKHYKKPAVLAGRL